MEFTPASQNGIVPPTELLSLPSRFGILVSTTSTVYGKPILIKAVSDAAMYKTEPVVFKTYHNGTTSTLGTAQFSDTANAVLVLDTLNTGTHSIWAEWPGEGLYAPVTSINNPVTVTMAAGNILNATVEITITPNSGTVVEGEGDIDIEVFINTAIQLSGNIQFFNGNTQIGIVPILNNLAILQNVNLPAGTNNIRVVWPGATIGGTVYQGLSSSTSYTVLSGSPNGASVFVSINPTTGVAQEGNVTLTATLNSSTVYPGRVYFSVNGEPLLYGELSNNVATVTARNVYNSGTYAITALWDGNQTSHPRYVQKSTSTNWTVVPRATLPALNFSVTPSPTSSRIETTFSANFNTSTSIDGIISFIEQGGDVIGTAQLVNNSAVFKTSSLTTGTKIVYAYFPGSIVEPKYFPVTSNTQTLVVTSGLNIYAPLNLTITPVNKISSEYVIDEPVNFTSKITTSTTLTNVVKVFSNNRYKTESAWVRNTTTSTSTFSSTGTYDIFSYWVGDVINGTPYEGKYSTVTSITVVDRATMPYNLILRSSQNPNTSTTGSSITFTVTATTSSYLSGNVEFKIDDIWLTTDPYWDNVVFYSGFETWGPQGYSQLYLDYPPDLQEEGFRYYSIDNYPQRATYYGFNEKNRSESFQTNSQNPINLYPKITNFDKKYGRSSLFKTTATYMTMTLSPASNFTFGTGDWTVEFWAKIQDNTGSAYYNNNYGVITLNAATGGSQGEYGGDWCLFSRQFESGNPVAKWKATWFNSSPFVSVGTTYSHSTVLNPDEWYHIAFTRKSGVLYISVNGQVENKGSYTKNIIGPNNGTWFIGNTGVGAEHYGKYYLDDVKITKGVGKYTQNFTPSFKPQITQTLPALIGTGTFVNGVASVNYPTATVSTGTYTISAHWLGTDVTPKFYPKDAINTVSQRIIR